MSSWEEGQGTQERTITSQGGSNDLADLQSSLVFILRGSQEMPMIDASIFYPLFSLSFEAGVSPCLQAALVISLPNARVASIQHHAWKQCLLLKTWLRYLFRVSG